MSSKCIRGSPTGGQLYYKYKRPIALAFVLSPTPFGAFYGQDWCGCMSTKCNDISRLMREGFYWDVSNIVREETHIHNTPKPCSGEEHPVHQNKNLLSETYTLLALGSRSCRYTPSPLISYVQRLRSDLLSRANIDQTAGCDHSGNDVYYYSTGNPDYRLY
ncbi:hypothetical protein F5Y18DRAFT_378117, partial [Xylariaceae sp. FL1019]